MSNTTEESNQLPKHFHHLTVSEIHRETQHAVSVRFELPADLKANYHFKAGQYLTLMHTINGESLRRPYSLCVSPAEQELRICTKQIPDGRMSSFINTELKVGDQLAVMEPNGRFCTDINPGQANRYVGIAGGSGITPILSLLSTLLRSEPNSAFTLLYGNRSSADIIFREKLADLKSHFLDRLQVVHILSEEQTEVELFHGLLDSERVERLITGLLKPDEIDQYFICGPGPMMDGAAAALDRLGIDKQNVKIESFGSAQPAAQAGKLSSNTETDQAIRSQATIKVGGKSLEVGIPDGRSVLDAALAAKLDLPYACKGGVCCTCKAMLVEGTVEMAVNYGLEADEIARGYVLTCQAMPTSDKVVVDYDI